MAATKTLKQIRDRAKLLADMENSEFISESEWNANINDSCQQLYNILCEVRGQEYYATTDTSSATVSGTTLYSLPADFFFLLDLTLDDGVRYVNPHTFELKERASLLSGTGTIDEIRYRLQPSQIEMLPAPSGAFNITLIYVPTFTELASDGATFDGINGFERWVEFSAAIVALMKEELDPAQLVAERAKIEAQIDRLKGRRDAGNPPRIQDTYRDWAGEDWPGWDA